MFLDGDCLFFQERLPSFCQTTQDDGGGPAASATIPRVVVPATGQGIYPRGGLRSTDALEANPRRSTKAYPFRARGA